MSRYLARRHRRLMDESEQALLEASQSTSQRKSRISGQILGDDRIHSLWESRHAKMLVPVAEHRKSAHQIVELRLMASSLAHGRAFIEYIRNHALRGKERERFFSYYYGPTDYQNAILSAHRGYMLSVSSTVSASHLIDVMHDPTSHHLLRQYNDVYKQYFELKSFAAHNDDEFCARALAPLAQSARTQLHAIRSRLMKEPAHETCSEFERQACLAKSGRYPVLNYLNE